MSPVRVAVFFGLTAIVLGLLNLHALAWVNRAFAPSRRVRRALQVSLFAALAGMVLGRVIDSALTDAPVTWLLAVSGTVELAVLMSVALLLPADAVRLFAGLVRRARTRWVKKREPLGRADGSVAGAAGAVVPRRAVLAQAAAGSAFLIGGSSAAYGALIGRHDYALEDFPVRIPGLARALDGFTIVQLSDIHIGQFVGEPELRVAEELIVRAHPDLIVLTGDLLDHDAALAGRLGHFVRRLVPLAREGVVAISGNHDFYAGIAPIRAAVRAAGGRMLVNAAEVVGRGQAAFSLLGVEDVWARRTGGGPDLERAVSALPEAARELPRVLLCHNPSYFEEAAGKVALQLSGHTHGGQVSLGVNPAEWFVKHGWVRGSYDYRGSRLYVNRGFGTVGPPARVGSPPELTRVVLTV